MRASDCRELRVNGMDAIFGEIVKTKHFQMLVPLAMKVLVTTQMKV